MRVRSRAKAEAIVLCNARRSLAGPPSVFWNPSHTAESRRPLAQVVNHCHPRILRRGGRYPEGRFQVAAGRGGGGVRRRLASRGLWLIDSEMENLFKHIPDVQQQQHS